jgi:hypothetical protein
MSKIEKDVLTSSKLTDSRNGKVLVKLLDARELAGPGGAGQVVVQVLWVGQRAFEFSHSREMCRRYGWLYGGRGVLRELPQNIRHEQHTFQPAVPD